MKTKAQTNVQPLPMPSDHGHGWRYLVTSHGDRRLPEASRQLEHGGYAILPGCVPPELVAELRHELERIFASEPTEVDRLYDFAIHRYLLFERHPLFQRMIGWRPILDAIEPLLGNDCHVIANSGWSTPPGYGGGSWHTDAGPHVPRPEGVPWDDRIPYPIFVIGCMVYLNDVPLEGGPTAVVPRSHRSGRPAPTGEENPRWEDQTSVPLIVKAGDVALFSSDIWHRGLPHRDGPGRMIFQMHYGRRDIAPRYAPCLNRPLTETTVQRADSDRARRLIGLHPVSFYG